MRGNEDTNFMKQKAAKGTKTKRKQPIEKVEQGPVLERFSPCYMVWVEGSYPPNKRHADLTSAMVEADRLCRKLAVPVYVLADVLRVEPAVAPLQWRESSLEEQIKPLRSVAGALKGQ